MTDKEYQDLLNLRKCEEWKLTDLMWTRYKELEEKYYQECLRRDKAEILSDRFSSYE